MNLPSNVHEKHGRYYLVRRQAGRRSWLPLSTVSEGEGALAEALQRVRAPEHPETIAALLRLFVRYGMHDYAPDTVTEYTRCIRARLIPTFGHMRISSLTQAHIAQFLEEGRMGRRATLANRERAVLSSAYEWGMRKGYVGVNPCRGVRRNRERPSRVRVTDAQYLDAYRRAPTPVRNLMHIGYLTGLRLCDLVRLLKAWITPEGITVVESKTGRADLIEWTPLLRATVNRALEYAPARSPYLLVASRGQPWQKWAVQSAWKRLAPGFAFRQIRAKAATDAAHNVLGHRGQMLTRYVRSERLRPVA